MNAISRLLVRYLTTPSRRYEPFSVNPSRVLRPILRPCDVLLVEGNERVSVAIKYLTQSTWSHAAVYVGEALDPVGADDPDCLIEADLERGVIAVPLSKYEAFNTRICRPVGLTEEDRQRLLGFLIGRIGDQYDLKNVVDLLRYLLLRPPVPVRLRRRLLGLGSGDPTRAICSTLLAQAFQLVGYPILPHIEKTRLRSRRTGAYSEREILHIRHHSLFTPRDFDLSPYFRVVKPTLERGFDYRALQWDDSTGATPPPAIGDGGRPAADRAPPTAPPESPPGRN